MNSSTSLRNEVIKTIKNKIQLNQLQPNEILTEAQICNELNISRTPVREALIQLVADGVLKKIPRKGFTVEKLDTKSKLDFYSIYAVLDALAATLAINNLTKEDILKMHECVDKMEIALKYQNYPDYYNLQNYFHNLYISKCENPILINMINEMSSREIHRSYISNDVDKLFEALKESNVEHLEIIKLFERRNIQELENFLRFTHWATKYPDMI